MPISCSSNFPAVCCSRSTQIFLRLMHLSILFERNNCICKWPPIYCMQALISNYQRWNKKKGRKVKNTPKLSLTTIKLSNSDIFSLIIIPSWFLHFNRKVDVIGPVCSAIHLCHILHIHITLGMPAQGIFFINSFSPIHVKQ